MERASRVEGEVGRSVARSVGWRRLGRRFRAAARCIVCCPPCRASSHCCLPHRRHHRQTRRPATSTAKQLGGCAACSHRIWSPRCSMAAAATPALASPARTTSRSRSSLSFWSSSDSSSSDSCADDGGRGRLRGSRRAAASASSWRAAASGGGSRWGRLCACGARSAGSSGPWQACHAPWGCAGGRLAAPGARDHWAVSVEAPQAAWRHWPGTIRRPGAQLVRRQPHLWLLGRLLLGLLVALGGRLALGACHRCCEPGDAQVLARSARPHIEPRALQFWRDRSRQPGSVSLSCQEASQPLCRSAITAWSCRAIAGPPQLLTTASPLDRRLLSAW